MKDVLEFIFSSFWVYAGVTFWVILLVAGSIESAGELSKNKRRE